SKRNRHSAEEELPRVLARQDRMAWEEYAVPQRQRHVTGDPPVQEEIRLPPQSPLVACRLFDGGVRIGLVEYEQIGSDLKPRQRPVLRERERADPEPQHEQVAGLRGERQSGIEQAEGVEGIVAGVRLVPAERIR